MAGFDNEVMFALGERLLPSTAQAILLMQQQSTDVARINHTGDPEGAVSANPSSISHDPVSGALYLKVSGTGNTGWQEIVPGGASITLTADDSNSLTGASFNLFGQKAGTIPIMDTLVSGGNFLFQNNSWETPYVIDKDTTTGLKGTFSTIQSALDQAVLDGMTFSNPKKFIIRPATTAYTENLTIPGGAFFYSAGGPTDPTAVPPFVTITGNHTLADICLFSTEGIQWTCPSGDLFTAGTTFCIMIARFSSLYNSGSGFILSAPSGTTIPVWNDCVFATGRTDFGSVFDIGSLQSCQITNCQFNGCGWEKAGGVLRFTDCLGVGEINQTSAVSPGIVSVNTRHFGDNNSNIYGSGTAVLISCSFANNNSSNYGVDLAAGASLIGCYMYPGAAQPRDFISPSTPGSYSYVQTGNVLKALRSATDVVSSSQANYIGITSTAAARAVTINHGPVDYQVYVVDESGGAGTNNITVTPNSGLINGQASFVINTNYGYALFHSDGTNFFTPSYLSQGVKVTTFSGSTTWNADARTKFVEVYGVHGGGGGGSGRNNASTQAPGGGGGGSGAGFYSRGPVAFYGSSQTVTVGSTAAGGAAVATATTNGNNGTNGNTSSFGNLTTANNATGGQGGTNSPGAGGSANIICFCYCSSSTNITAIGGVGGAAAGAAPLSDMGIGGNYLGGASGGGGGGYDSVTARAGGRGGMVTNMLGATLVAAGTAGIETGTLNGGNGANGTGSTNGIICFGAGGGGGGGGRTNPIGGTGGNGGTPAGGGGGGGGGSTGGTSGAGGVGAAGQIVVIEYF